MTKPKLLIIPDIEGWALSYIATGIVSILSNEFNIDIKYKEFKEEYLDIYDFIYIMIPGQIPKNLKDYSKIFTTFHGGPGIQGQANEIIKENFIKKGLTVSYVSTPVKKILNYSYKDDMFLTQCGIEPNQYNFTDGHHIVPIKCGYAGWAHYLLNKQANQRRGYWIMESQQKLTYSLSIAGGIRGHEESTKIFNTLYPDIKCKTYSPSDMKKFYNSINTYLIPDRYAGGPIPLLEAGLSGCAIISTKCGLANDILNDDVAIIVDTYEEFEEGIKKILTNRTLRKKYGKNIREHIKKTCKWIDRKEQWYNFFLKQS